MATTRVSYCARPEEYLFRFSRAEKRGITEVITSSRWKKMIRVFAPFSSKLILALHNGSLGRI